MTTSNGTTIEMTPAAPATAMVRHEERAMAPVTLTELRALAKDAADSRFFGAESQAQCLMIMLAGRDLGFSYTQALRAFHVIKGKPSLSADGMVAVCLSRPDLCEYFRPVSITETGAVWVTKRVGHDPVEGSFTMADAEKAGLLKQNADMFAKYPKRMLSARAKAFLARDVYPELLMGLLDPDEARESEPRRAPAAPRSAPSAIAEDPSPAAQAFLVSIANAATLAETKSVALAIADANLSAADRSLVQEAGKAREAAIRAELRKAAGK